VKRYRVRGKVVPLRDEEGKVIYERTPKGKRVKAKHVSQGDSIRGAIHDQTFYGKISKWKDDGSHEKEEQFVIRRKIEYKSGDIGSGFTKWEDLRDHMVDKKLFEQLKKNAEGKDFQKACAEGLFVYVVENGVKRKVRVRHVRCKEKTAQPLKKHTFQPRDKHVEQYYYVSPGEAYGIFEYKSNDGKYLYVSDSLFTFSEKMKSGRLRETPCPPSIIDKKGNEYFHTRTILKEDTLLIYPSTESPESQFKIDPITLSKRLYRINAIETQRKRIYLTRHTLAKSWTKTNTIDDSDFKDLPDGMRMTISNLHFLLLGTDFDIINGKIVPIRKTEG
jgi:hypothetical protein